MTSFAEKIIDSMVDENGCCGELALIRESYYDRKAFTYGYERVYIYTLADENDNCYVWKTAGYLEHEREEEDGAIEGRFARPGDKVKMRATVKEHDEYKGAKRTVLTRCKVSEIKQEMFAKLRR